ncbi:MAG: hypothetical protein IID31_10190 [Planctomycetes bacterium]|nr:hypothetical protein [Planctomycetota bacterium]
MPERTIRLYHTSSEPIRRITEGRFGAWLFFALDPYQMHAGQTNYLYRIDLPANEVITASSLFYEDNTRLQAKRLEALAERLAEDVNANTCLEVDSDTAYDLIGEADNLYRLLSDAECYEDNAAEVDWRIQLAAAEAAKILGYRAVEVTDEQGTAYMVAIAGKKKAWGFALVRTD